MKLPFSLTFTFLFHFFVLRENFSLLANDILNKCKHTIKNVFLLTILFLFVFRKTNQIRHIFSDCKIYEKKLTRICRKNENVHDCVKIFFTIDKMGWEPKGAFKKSIFILICSHTDRNRRKGNESCKFKWKKQIIIVMWKFFYLF